MEAIKCEICGGNELVKQDDYFVCQYCGTKYSLAEAQKLLHGMKVSIDQSESIGNLYVLARRAFSEGGISSSLKFYEKIITLDPNNWEPRFFVHACYILNAEKVNNEYESHLNELKNDIVHIIGLLVKDNCCDISVSRVVDIILELLDKLELDLDYLSYNARNTVYQDRDCYIAMICNAAETLWKFEEHKPLAVKLWKQLLRERICLGRKELFVTKEYFDDAMKKIHQYDPEYKSVHPSDKIHNTDKVEVRLDNSVGYKYKPEPPSKPFYYKWWFIFIVFVTLPISWPLVFLFFIWKVFKAIFDRD